MVREPLSHAPAVPPRHVVPAGHAAPPRRAGSPRHAVPPRHASLIDLLDRLLGVGVVVRGQITLAAAEIDLVDLDLGLVLAAVDKAASR